MLEIHVGWKCMFHPKSIDFVIQPPTTKSKQNTNFAGEPVKLCTSSIFLCFPFRGGPCSGARRMSCGGSACRRRRRRSDVGAATDGKPPIFHRQLIINRLEIAWPEGIENGSGSPTVKWGVLLPLNCDMTHFIYRASTTNLRDLVLPGPRHQNLFPRLAEEEQKQKEAPSSAWSL